MGIGELRLLRVMVWNLGVRVSEIQVEGFRVKDLRGAHADPECSKWTDAKRGTLRRDSNSKP